MDKSEIEETPLLRPSISSEQYKAFLVSSLHRYAAPGLWDS